MNLTQQQYDQLTLEFGMSPARVDQIVSACNADDLALIVQAEQLAGTIQSVSGWERFLQILGEVKTIADDLLPVFQIAAIAIPLL
jgi:hypothetical protein